MFQHPRVQYTASSCHDASCRRSRQFPKLITRSNEAEQPNPTTPLRPVRPRSSPVLNQRNHNFGPLLRHENYSDTWTKSRRSNIAMNTSIFSVSTTTTDMPAKGEHAKGGGTRLLTGHNCREAATEAKAKSEWTGHDRQLVGKQFVSDRWRIQLNVKEN